MPGPSPIDDADLAGLRIGVPISIGLLSRFGMSTQTGVIWLGTWGMLSVFFFVAGLAVLTFAGIQQMQGNMLLLIKYFANVQILPPEGLGMAPSLQQGGFWQIQLLLWAVSVVCWAGRCWDRLARFQMRPYLLFAWLSAILLTATIWLFRPIAMGSWAEAPGFGLNSDLDWAQNFSVLWGNLYYNPWHQLAIFFLFGSTMLWGMHGATILATAAEGSHQEDARDQRHALGARTSRCCSGAGRWAFNANPKTIHDWLLWFSMGTVLASAIGIIETGTIVKDWYVWGCRSRPGAAVRTDNALRDQRNAAEAGRRYQSNGSAGHHLAARRILNMRKLFAPLLVATAIVVASSVAPLLSPARAGTPGTEPQGMKPVSSAVGLPERAEQTPNMLYKSRLRTGNENDERANEIYRGEYGPVDQAKAARFQQSTQVRAPRNYAGGQLYNVQVLKGYSVRPADRAADDVLYDGARGAMHLLPQRRQLRLRHADEEDRAHDADHVERRAARLGAAGSSTIIPTMRFPAQSVA